MIGAIGVFHSVPADDLPASTRALNLDRCVLSGIFQRLITTWDHADILALNPGFSPPAGQPIKVVARENGSSSTTLTALYLSTAGAGCAYAWKLGTGSGGPGTCSTTAALAVGSTTGARKCPDWEYTAPAASGCRGVRAGLRRRVRVPRGEPVRDRVRRLGARARRRRERSQGLRRGRNVHLVEGGGRPRGGRGGDHRRRLGRGLAAQSRERGRPQTPSWTRSSAPGTP